MGFYISRPTSTATTYRVKEMGAVIAGADYLYEQHKELYKDVDGTVSGGIQYEEGKAVDDIVLAVLFGTNIEAKDKWGINIAARGYVIWTDGAKDIIVYSSNDDAKNDAYYDDKFDTAGTSIRSVNGIIRTIAGAVYNADPDLYPSFKGVETTFGAEYKGVDYTTIKSSLSADGVILTGGARDPEATLKMLIAFKNLITIIANE